MGTKRPRPVVLDAGALLAVERADRRVIRLLELAPEIHVPAGALAQAWRNLPDKFGWFASCHRLVS